MRSASKISGYGARSSIDHHKLLRISIVLFFAALTISGLIA